MTQTGNLPAWAGADGAYARAYRILANMARAGHVRGGNFGHGPINRYNPRCGVSPEMADIIDALNRGDEEQVKHNNLVWLRFDA